MAPHDAPHDEHTNAPPATSGLAIASMVVGLAGQCIMILGPFVALILGICALITLRGKRDAGTPRGMAIAGVVLGGLGILIGPFLLVMLLLPALSTAREAAYGVMSDTQMTMIAQGIDSYNATSTTPLELEDWDQRLVTYQMVDAGWLESPYSDGTAPSYFYVPPGTIDANTGAPTLVILYEHPDHHEDGGLVAYDSLNIEFLNTTAFNTAIGSLRHPDGTPFAPHLDAAAPAP